MRCLALAVRCVLLVGRCLLVVLRRSLFVVGCCVLLGVCRCCYSLCVVRRLPFGAVVGNVLLFDDVVGLIVASCLLCLMFVV